MSQNYKEDYTGSNLNQILGVGGELGKALKALKTDFAGPLEPVTGVEAFSTWLDLSDINSIKLKRRTVDNLSWAVIWIWDGTIAPPVPSGDFSLVYAVVFGS